MFKRIALAAAYVMFPLITHSVRGYWDAGTILGDFIVVSMYWLAAECAYSSIKNLKEERKNGKSKI